MRFHDFLRTAVLLFAGSATALAVVGMAGASTKDDRTLVYVALGWWLLAGVAGLALGRGARSSPGIERLMATARTASALPEIEPGTILFNRLWALAVFTIVAGGLAFLVPQVPVVGAGYALVVALAWRKQAGAVEAIEGRDGVRFYVEAGSPLRPTRLIRTPGFRRIEPVQEREGTGATT